VEIADAYRKARRNTSIFCGISLAWSAAQFELKSLNIGNVGKIDISGASIPIILACLIMYTMVRCTLEFMMQPNEIRRWNLAQVDYKITLNLVRISLLIIAAATASRSIETVVAVIVAALSLGLGYFVLVAILMLMIFPLRIYIRGGSSVAARSEEALFWSMFIAAILYILFFITLGFSAIKHVPFFDILPPILRQISTIIFAITCIIISVSFFLEHIMSEKIFAFEPEEIIVETKLPDGTTRIQFKDNPKHPDYVASSPAHETQKEK
jgi:hypothetical protein